MVWVTQNTFCTGEGRNQSNEILGSWHHLNKVHLGIPPKQNRKQGGQGRPRRKRPEGSGGGQWGKSSPHQPGGLTDCHSCHWKSLPREHWVMQLPQVMGRGGKQRSEVRSQEAGTHLPREQEKWGKGEKTETLSICTLRETCQRTPELRAK